MKVYDFLRTDSPYKADDIVDSWAGLTPANNEDFHPDDYEATVNPPKQKPVMLTLDNTLQFLREQGADPETLKLIQQQCSA